MPPSSDSFFFPPKFFATFVTSQFVLCVRQTWARHGFHFFTAVHNLPHSHKDTLTDMMDDFFISLWTKPALISFVPGNTCVHSAAQCAYAEIKLISLGDCPYLGNVKSNQCIYSWLEMDPEKLLFMFHIHSYLLSRTVMFKEMQPSSFAFVFA